MHMNSLSTILARVALCAIVVGLTGVPAGQAGSIVGGFDWSTSGDLEGWESDEMWADLSNPGAGGTGGAGDGYLNIHFDPTTEMPPTEWFTLVKVDASRLFAGAWQSEMWVEFDFWANDAPPDYVEIHWAGQSGNEWSSRVFDATTSSMDEQTWTRLTSAQFESYQDWDYGGGTQQQFVEDLASIDWIGVYVGRDSADAQDFGVDNFNLMVPEPTQSVMLLASAAAVILSMRQRKRGESDGAGAGCRDDIPCV